MINTKTQPLEIGAFFMDIKAIAEELANTELGYLVQLGVYKYNKVWEHIVEECHGPHDRKELSAYGREIFDGLVDKWIEKINLYT